MRRPPILSAILVAGTALSVGTLGLAAPSAFARPAVTDASAVAQWHVVARLARGGFDAVTAPARASAWAFGNQRSISTGRVFAVARHWNGHRWSGVQRVSPLKSSSAVCAGASSSSNVWAFTQAGGGMGDPPSNASAMRLQAGHWVTAKVLSSPLGRYVTGCNVLGPANVWVFGGELAGLGGGVGTWHLTSSRWSQLNTGNLVLFNASAVSPRDIWAAGADVSTTTPQPALGRWNGTTWTEDSSIAASLPKSAGTRWVVPRAIRAFSSSDVWVLTEVQQNFRETGVLVVHWNGTKWSRVKPGSRGYYLPTAVADGHGGWWSEPYLTSATVPYLLHEANGRWARFPIPVPLEAFGLSLVHVPGSRTTLACGTADQHGQTSGVVLAVGTLPN